jgi:glycosyltransferase involved in cell wall biosynthesis
MLLTLKGGNEISNTVPAKLQTYMSSSKAVLAMIDGEANSIIKEAKCGLVANAGDFQKLADNIIKMKNLSINELKDFEKKSRDYYLSNFSRKVAMDKIEKIVNEIA